MKLDLKKLIVKLLNASAFNGAGNWLGTFVKYNHCTGTLRNELYFTSTNNGEVYVQGRLSISSYNRTGAYPAIYLTLPDHIPTPTVTRNTIVGFRSQDAREMVSLHTTASSREVYLYTTESYTNATGTILTFMCNGRAF